jgi:hypothetical protein
MLQWRFVSNFTCQRNIDCAHFLIIFVVRQVWRHHLPIGSAFIVLCEQTRLTMKTHSYVRETSKMREMEKDNDSQPSELVSTHALF